MHRLKFHDEDHDHEIADIIRDLQEESEKAGLGRGSKGGYKFSEITHSEETDE